MAIPIDKYISITSGVGGGNNVAMRQLMGNVFTADPKVDPLVPLTFSGNDAVALVGKYFGTDSEEYKRAAFYFGYISPTITRPQNIMFSRYLKTDSPARIFGKSGSYAVSQFTGITAGVMKFNFAGTIITVTGINFSAASLLADVASELQTALRLNSDAHLATCTIAYDAVNARFTFTASSSGVADGAFVMIQDGTTGTDVASVLGWYTSQGALNISSAAAKSALDCVTDTIGITNNFGSICFTYDAATQLADWTAIATFLQTLNVMFMFNIPVTAANYVATSAALVTIAGVGMTYDINTEYDEMIPMAIMAATNYGARNGVVNYMFRQIPGATPSVIDETLANTLSAARVNYYGQTQQAGQFVSLYQDGVLTGDASAPQAMNIFANEMWLKSFIQSKVLSLQLSLSEVSANITGKGQLLSVLQTAIDLARYNGVISAGKTLTDIQQLYITQMTGDNTAYLQVQNIGYWIDMTITSSVDNNSGLTIYTANYTLIYSKNDAVRKVEGTHVLI